MLLFTKVFLSSDVVPYKTDVAALITTARPFADGMCKKVMPFFQVPHEMICLRLAQKIRIFIADDITSAICTNTFGRCDRIIYI